MRRVKGWIAAVLAAVTIAAPLVISQASGATVKRFASKVTLAASNPFHGRVISKKRACQAERTVKVFDASGGLFGSTMSNGTGRWSIPATPHGDFYARVTRRSEGAGGTTFVCRGARSVTRTFGVTGHIYWTNFGNGTIGRANLDGTSATQSFITGANGPTTVAVDDQFVYWANANTGTIGRATVNGGGVDQSFVTGASVPTGVAVDAQHIWWTNDGTGTIGRANLDGTGADQSFISGASSPTGIAVEGVHVWWGNMGGPIGRAKLDGTGVDQSFVSGAHASGVALDARHVWWADYGNGTIGRANLDGTGVRGSYIAGATAPYGPALRDKTLWWSNYGANTIGTANVNGTGINQSLVAGADGPEGIAVDPGPPDTAITRSRVSSGMRKATFRFAGAEGIPPYAFKCRLDNAAFRTCASPTTYKRLGSGRHTFEVEAIDSTGKTDPTPARARFRIGS